MESEQTIYEEIESSINKAQEVTERVRGCGQDGITDLAQYSNSLRHTLQCWNRINREIDGRLISLGNVSLSLSKYRECHQQLLSSMHQAEPTPGGDTQQNNTQSSGKGLELRTELQLCAGLYVEACKTYELQTAVFAGLVQPDVWPRAEQTCSALETIFHQTVRAVGCPSPWASSGGDWGIGPRTAARGRSPREPGPGDQASDGERPAGGHTEPRPRIHALQQRRLTIESLLEARTIGPATAQQLQEGQASAEGLSCSIHPYLEGLSCVAGVLVREDGRKLPIYQAVLEGKLRPGTGFLLLEDQAASGFLVDPVRALRLTVSQAVRAGLVGRELRDKLLCAERAVTGYTDPNSGALLSLPQALGRGLILLPHALRLLEAQVATGGIIDPQRRHRLPVEAAYRRGLFTRELHAALSDPNHNTKGFFHPNTQQNLTYLQLSRTCIRDPDTGLQLLPLGVTGSRSPGTALQ
uniref:epiplakin-like n=1 Tax=Pristiophorus japonicus TaxID=55135 RepID=UPI00398EABA6